MVTQLMSDELQRIWKESLMVSLRYHPIICLEEERNVRKIAQALWLVSNLRSDLGIPKCKDRMLPHTHLQQTHLVCDQFVLTQQS